MRFMMLVIPKDYDKAGPDFAPPAELVARMTKYNESLTKAGILLSLDGLHVFDSDGLVGRQQIDNALSAVGWCPLIGQMIGIVVRNHLVVSRNDETSRWIQDIG